MTTLFSIHVACEHFPGNDIADDAEAVLKADSEMQEQRWGVGVCVCGGGTRNFCVELTGVHWASPEHNGFL